MMKSISIVDKRIFVFLALIAFGCNPTVSEEPDLEKEKEENTDTCGDALTINLTTTESGCGDESGKLVIEVSGGTAPYTYSLDGSDFQSEATFEGLAFGAINVTVKDKNGCESSVEGHIETGISYENSVQSIIETNCSVSGCHNGSNNGIPDFSTFSEIQDKADRIKARTSDGTMPPASIGSLSDSDIEAIACWVNDGAKNN